MDITMRDFESATYDETCPCCGHKIRPTVFHEITPDDEIEIECPNCDECLILYVTYIPHYVIWKDPATQ